ncbi:MAG: cation transporter [Deltaproteobacteria bacterium]|nr:cation transporter [Deltaproteobacteria bacterium]
MAGCCEGSCDALVALRAKQAHVLKIVLAINAAMFVVEIIAGLASQSSSLLADSLDMLGDAVVYATTLYVLGRGVRWQARMAVVKGAIMILFGLGVVTETTLKAIGSRAPDAGGMGVVGGLALVANLVCLYLLSRHREDDINMRSVWVCSRNDIIANVGVLIAAAGVHLTGTRWPDVVVGAAIALVFLSTATRVMRDAFAALRLSPARQG